MRFFTITSSFAGTLAFYSTIVWAVITAYGELFGGAPNSGCYPYLGCSSGFYGYDALEHFLFGFATIWIIIWLFKKFPHYSLMHDKFWKSAIILIAIVTLIEVIWEIGESFRDAYLLNIAHVQLVNLKLQINYLAQPSNLDTMGDIAFNLLGSILALLSTKPWKREG